MTVSKGAEEARNHLPELLHEAEKGHATIITKHGRPVAALVPIAVYNSTAPQRPLIPLAGSGGGLWGTDSARTIAEQRDEWSH